jgi:hypothetical protein
MIVKILLVSFPKRVANQTRFAATNTAANSVGAGIIIRRLVPFDDTEV